MKFYSEAWIKEIKRGENLWLRGGKWGKSMSIQDRGLICQVTITAVMPYTEFALCGCMQHLFWLLQKAIFNKYCPYFTSE